MPLPPTGQCRDGSRALYVRVPDGRQERYAGRILKDGNLELFVSRDGAHAHVDLRDVAPDLNALREVLVAAAEVVGDGCDWVDMARWLLSILKHPTGPPCPVRTEAASGPSESASA